MLLHLLVLAQVKTPQKNLRESIIYLQTLFWLPRKCYSFLYKLSILLFLSLRAGRRKEGPKSKDVPENRLDQVATEVI